MYFAINLLWFGCTRYAIGTWGAQTFLHYAATDGSNWANSDATMVEEMLVMKHLRRHCRKRRLRGVGKYQMGQIA